MLSLDCRRFRAAFTPGEAGPHRRSCAACGLYAAALERAARREPLPARLRSRLRAIPAAAPGEGDRPRLPQPQVSLPRPLGDRLRAVARQAEPPRQIPVWVRSSRYAMAASYLLALLVGSALGNPADLGRQAADAFSRLGAAGLVEQVEETVAERLSRAGARGRRQLESWQSAVRARYGETRGTVEESLGSLGAQVSDLSQNLRSIDLPLQGE